MIKEKNPLLWETRLAQFSTGQQRTNSVWLWLWTRHYRSEVRLDWILSRSIWWSVIHLASSIIKDKDLLPRSFIRHLLYKEVPHLVSCSAWPPQPPLILWRSHRAASTSRTVAFSDALLCFWFTSSREPEIHRNLQTYGSSQSGSSLQLHHCHLSQRRLICTRDSRYTPGHVFRRQASGSYPISPEIVLKQDKWSTSSAFPHVTQTTLS